MGGVSNTNGGNIKCWLEGRVWTKHEVRNSERGLLCKSMLLNRGFPTSIPVTPKKKSESGRPDDTTTFLSSSLMSPRKQRLFSGFDTDQLLRPLSTTM
jgi:hypothetical protein